MIKMKLKAEQFEQNALRILTVSDIFEPRRCFLISTALISGNGLVLNLFGSDLLIVWLLCSLLNVSLALDLHLLILVVVCVFLLRRLPVHLGPVRQATWTLPCITWVSCQSIPARLTNIWPLTLGVIVLLRVLSYRGVVLAVSVVSCSCVWPLLLSTGGHGPVLLLLLLN